MIQQLDEVEELVLAPDQSVMCEMSEAGDVKTFWNRNNQEEIGVAADTFRRLKAKGYTGYKLAADGNTKGEVLHEFDPKAERIVLTPPFVGG